MRAANTPTSRSSTKLRKYLARYALRDATKVWYLTAWWKTPVLAAAAMYARLVRNVNFVSVYRVHIFAERNAFHLIMLSASTYIDQLRRFKVLDSEMPNLFRDASDMIAVRKAPASTIWDAATL